MSQMLNLEVGTSGPAAAAPAEAASAYYPFSGNVTQTINPWTWFLRLSGIEVGQLTVNLGTSTDPELERQILRDVGTYGRQIGVLGDALGVLMRHVDKLVDADLSPDDRYALARLRKQLDKINDVKLERLYAPSDRSSDLPSGRGVGP